MKNSLLAAFVATLVFATAAFSQSSKFAATYDTDEVLVSVKVNGAPICVVDADGITICKTMGATAEQDVTSLHVAQWKEILGTISSQVNLVTFTQAKGKNNAGSSTAIAEGSVRVGMAVIPAGGDINCAAEFLAYDEGGENAFAAPGVVTFASRRQELSVDVSLDVVGSIPDVCDAQCIEDNLSIDGSVSVALGLDTTAAHAFQFIAADLTSGDYNVVACYDLAALAEVGGADIDADTAAMSKVAIGPRIITAQEVRAVKGGILDETGGNSVTIRARHFSRTG